MPNPRIVPVAGLPRSGSTLLLNILGQNPAHHVTPTSGLLDLMHLVRENWVNLNSYKAQGLKKIEPRIISLLRSMAYGFYSAEFSDAKIVFDKSRGWVGQLDFFAATFPQPPFLIYTIRDVKETVASLEKMQRRNMYIKGVQKNPLIPGADTIEKRCAIWCSDEGIVGAPLALLRNALFRQQHSSIIFVEYHSLVRQPHKVLNYVHDVLGLPPFAYNFSSIEQLTEENDEVYGWSPDLHKVRPRLEAAPKDAWQQHIPPLLGSQIDQKFEDIQEIVNGLQAHFGAFAEVDDQK